MKHRPKASCDEVRTGARILFLTLSSSGNLGVTARLRAGLPDK